MRHAQRRVKKLRFESNSDSTLNGDLLALQDAFNIASLSGVPPNGLLLIRRLELERLSPGASSQKISGIIDKKVKKLCYQAVCVDEQDAINANIVWFSDPFNAAIRLLEGVYKRRQVNAWYWPVLFKGYKPAMNIADALMLVSREAEHKHSPLALMAAVIQHQLELGYIERTLAAITPQLAQTILSDSGFFPHAIDTAGYHRVHPSRLKSMSVKWKQVLRLSLVRWGNTDVRSRWMAVNALVNLNPTLLDAGRLLMFEADNLVEHVQQKIQPSCSRTEGGSRGSENTIGEKKDAFQQVCKTSKESVSNTDIEATSPDTNRVQANRSSTTMTKEHPVVTTRNETQSGEITIEDGAERERINSPEENDCGTGFSETINRSQTDSTIDKDILERDRSLTFAENSENDSFIPDRLTESHPFDAFEFHPQSGLLFVVSILQALKIDECLKFNPDLANANLAVRIIRRLAKRFGIDQGHPLLQCITELAVENEAIEHFISPRFWVDLLAFKDHDQMTLHLFETGNDLNQCALTDHHNKLLLFAGDASELPEWIDDYRVARKLTNHRIPNLADIETTVTLLISRYLNRYANCGLAGLINRPGRIVNTRTHLDVIFDQEQVDINIRRAGLDINPGWVSWLGRVVQYHYVSGDLIDD